MNKKKTISFAIVFFLVAINTFLLFSALDIKMGKGYSEISEIEQKFNEQSTFNEVADYFETLAQNKGAEYAYEVLKVAPLPDLDMHLMAHVVGDVLYKQKGAEGMNICTHDFRNACSHSIVVGIFQESGGINIWPEVKKACESAPGGKGAYRMCFHGVGHGVFSYTGYDLKKTVEVCRGMEEYSRGNNDQREWKECVGGAIMELVGGGFENRELWKKQRKKYISEANPLSPCNTDIIPDGAKGLCYSYLTPNLFITAGGTLANPQPEHFDKAFEYCEQIPEERVSDRENCFAGVGKEFPLLVIGRDTRSLESMTNDQLRTIYEWCLLADDGRKIRYCTNSIVNSLYWGGENDRTLAQRFCSAMDPGTVRNSCWSNLIRNVRVYIDDTQYKQGFCSEIPSEHQQECSNVLL